MPTIQLRDDLPFTPNDGGQSHFMHDCEHRYVALAGGLGSGKTVAGSRKLVDLHVYNAFDEVGGVTLCKSAVVGDSYGNLFRYDVPALEAALQEAGLSCSVRRGAENPHIAIPELGTKADPSLIYLCSAQRPERISGFEVGGFWCDEASRYPEARGGDPKTDPMVQIRGRLRGSINRFEQGLFTFTNEGDSTGVYKFFHDDNDGDRAYYVASTRDNAKHVQSFLDDQLRNLSPDLVRQYVDGQAINLRGAFAYTCFNEAEHVVSEMKLDPARPLCMAIDFNINPGMHVYLGQFDRAADTFRIRHEIHAPRLTIEAAIDRVRDIIAQSGGFKHPGVLVYGDASGRGEWVGTSQSHYMLVAECLDRIGLRRKWRMKIPPANPRIANRINAVQSALKDMGGKIHIQIHSSCGILINDMKMVKWDDKGKELDKKNPALTHASDALGYFVHRVRPLRFKSSGRGGGRFSVSAAQRSIYA